MSDEDSTVHPPENDHGTYSRQSGNPHSSLTYLSQGCLSFAWGVVKGTWNREMVFTAASREST